MGISTKGDGNLKTQESGKIEGKLRAKTKKKRKIITGIKTTIAPKKRRASHDSSIRFNPDLES